MESVNSSANILLTISRLDVLAEHSFITFFMPLQRLFTFENLQAL